MVECLPNDYQTSKMKADRNNTTALILSGGQGRRMNYRDKGLLLWKNKALVSHVIDSIKNQLDQIVINANQHHEDYQQLNLPLIKDSIEGYQGPLSGILSGMQFCTESDYLLVLPCDCPTPPDDLFNRLATTMNKNKETEITIVNDGSRLQPLFGLYKTSLRPKLESALANQHNKVMQFVTENNHLSVDYSAQAEAFKNFNRPEDLK